MATGSLRALGAGAPLLALMLAGCISGDTVEIPDTLDDTIPRGFVMEATNCIEGGGVSTYAGPREFGDGYESADISEEVNSPYPKYNPSGMGGHQWANWHMGFKCETATSDGVTESDFLLGFVGQAVQPPAWDPGGADMHFIVTGLGFGNGTFRDTLRDVTKADISQAYEAVVDWYIPKDSPRSAAYVVFSDIQKGVYMQYSNMEHYREFPDRTVRYWWGVPTDGSQSTAAHGHNPGELDGTWHPVYFDITTTGGHQWSTPPVDRGQMFCHMGNDDHGTPFGGICEPTHTTVYEHGAITFRAGEVITSVTMETMHVH